MSYTQTYLVELGHGLIHLGRAGCVGWVVALGLDPLVGLGSLRSLLDYVVGCIEILGRLPG
ncbi:UNVERIFIED_CONTAM: hypothetical protein Slati_0432200 [Sesamum latifolium]|uniref:Uncharacterized protein n=1 Tax=Sesamum latifolium TaxID=2727402 RepID=A0AAW2XVN8_9LAMI